MIADWEGLYPKPEGATGRLSALEGFHLVRPPGRG
jgi:hypothetical protein